MFLTRKRKIKVGNLKFTKKTEFDESKTELVDDLSNKKFDETKGRILVDRKNKIMDGHHRVHLLKEHYGDDHIVTVEKLLVHKITYYAIVFSLAHILMDLMTIIEGIWYMPKKIKNGIKEIIRRNKGNITQKTEGD
jgi:hypothetical protein